ncbi:hypothetical protein, partial [Klebsiella aerogenes]|uniref:hypothetical protein n=1 Tax=Klebsiella aerogenes TaxID=548 RepID=UPI0019543B04
RTTSSTALAMGSGEGQPISVAELWALLELDAPALRPAGEHRFCVVISTGEAADSLALIVLE